jgi:hypothetical protein
MKLNLKRKQKEMKPKADNKFAGKRQHGVRTGTPNKTLTRLTDLYELLHCDPDEDGYVITTFKEMNELTEIDVNMLTILVANGVMRKAKTGTSPKFKYKWDTIKPTMDMAMKLADERIKMKTPADPEAMKEPENIISESKPESINPKPEDTIEPSFENIVIDSVVSTDNILTMHVNLNKLSITETDVITAVLAINANK